jgi:hypothetical protein
MDFRIVIALMSVCASVAAHADDFQSDDQIVLFPLADMDSEINSSLKTVVEAGETRPALMISGEDVLPKELTNADPQTPAGKPH